MYSNMQPWRFQNGALSASLYKANSKPEMCSETGSQREQTLGTSKSSKSKEHQDKYVQRYATVAHPKWSHECISIQGQFKPEMYSEIGSQREQTLGASKSSKSKEHQDKYV